MKFISSCLALLALSACHSQALNLTSQSPVGFNQELMQTQFPSAKAIDVSQGQFKTPAAFGFSLKFSEPEFQTLASSSGGVAKTGSDLSDFNLYLLECVTSGVPAAGTATVPVDLEAAPNCGVVYQVKKLKAGGFAGSQSFVFENIPPNSAANKNYFVAVAAEQTGANISQPTGYIIGGATPSNGPIALSNSGGNGSGSVHVDANYSLAGQTSSLGIALVLRAEKGAKVDSTVNVTDGTASYSGSISVSTP